MSQLPYNTQADTGAPGVTSCQTLQHKEGMYTLNPRVEQVLGYLVCER